MNVIDSYLNLENSSVNASWLGNADIIDIINQYNKNYYYPLNFFMTVSDSFYYGTNDDKSVHSFTASLDQQRFGTLEEIKEAKNVAYKVASSLTGSDYDKVKATYEYLCKNLEYDFVSLNNYSMDGHSIYSALCEHKTVCEGYAMAFQAIMEYCNIPSYIVVGTINGVGHAWNVVCVEGKWYYVDATSGDGNSVDYSYFLFGTSKKRNIYGLDISEYSYGEEKNNEGKAEEVKKPDYDIYDIPEETTTKEEPTDTFVDNSSTIIEIDNDGNPVNSNSETQGETKVEPEGETEGETVADGTQEGNNGGDDLDDADDFDDSDADYDGTRPTSIYDEVVIDKEYFNIYDYAIAILLFIAGFALVLIIAGAVFIMKRR